MGRPATYNLNENYFEKIDTHEKAYILGFIVADGCVKKSGLTIVIKSSDDIILKFIKKEMECDIPIRYFSRQLPCIKGYYAGLDIARIKIVKDLERLGVMQNKTYLMKSFPKVDERLFGSFLLGFFDGDGYISDLSKDNCICFSNSLSILKELQNYLIERFGIKGCLRHRRGIENVNSCMLDIKGSFQIEKIYHLMYSDCKFSLYRKKNRFFKILESAEKQKNRLYKSNGNLHHIVELYKSGVSQLNIAKRMALPRSSVRGTIQRARKKGLIPNVLEVKFKQKIKIDGIVFDSLADGGKYLNIAPSSLLYRVNKLNMYELVD